MRLIEGLKNGLKDFLYFQLDSKDTNAARIRAGQISALASTTPYMMAANFINAAVVLISLYGKPGTMLLPVWAGMLFLISVVGLFQWNQSRKIDHPKTASARGIKKLIRNSALLGILWGILPLMVYPGGDLGSKLIVTACAGGMLGGGTIAINKIPQALIAYIIPIFAGISIALLLSGTPADMAILVLLLCYTISLIKAGHSAAISHVESRQAAFEVSDQAATIKMLLTDFSEGAKDWLWETDIEGRLSRGQDQFSQHFGFGLFSLNPADMEKNGSVQKPGSCKRALEDLWNCFKAGQPFKGIAFPVHFEAGTRWISMSGKPIVDEMLNIRGYRGVASDVTEIKQAEERIAYLAYNDALTGLVNRANYNATLERLFEEDPRGNWCNLYLDLDGFKQINDHYGHMIGDKVLVEVGQRLKKFVGEKDVVARLGGDEFSIICQSARTVQSVSAMADKIVEAISRPFLIDGNAFAMSVSIGIAFAGNDGDCPQQLINNSDLALYRAKGEGKSTYRFYEMEMDEVVKQRRLMEADLREAVKNKQLSLNFQPLIDARNEKTAGFEALARWYHPNHGQVPPSDFIPIAERIGLVSEIGDWVLMAACSEAMNWPEDLSVAVNLSPQQFQDDRIIDTVKWVLEKTGLAPERLELEITESLFIDNTEAVLDALNKLKTMGVSVALDDFGTGYSSLSYLLKFPFDKLKIDRSFISSVGKDAIARDVLEAITKLGGILELNVTAEGVETTDQVDMLRGLSCTHFQGFHFGKPLEIQDLPRYLLNELKHNVDTGKTSRAKAGKVAAKRKKRS